MAAGRFRLAGCLGGDCLGGDTGAALPRVLCRLVPTACFVVVALPRAETALVAAGFFGAVPAPACGALALAATLADDDTPGLGLAAGRRRCPAACLAIAAVFVVVTRVERVRGCDWSKRTAFLVVRLDADGVEVAAGTEVDRRAGAALADAAGFLAGATRALAGALAAAGAVREKADWTPEKKPVTRCLIPCRGENGVQPSCWSAAAPAPCVPGVSREMILSRSSRSPYTVHREHDKRHTRPDQSSPGSGALQLAHLWCGDHNDIRAHISGVVTT